MLQITSIHMRGGQGHEHIATLKYFFLPSGNEQEATRQSMVDWVKANPSGSAIVHHGGKTVAVGVWTTDSGTEYLRTYADGYFNDNLLSLPRY